MPQCLYLDIQIHRIKFSISSVFGGNFGLGGSTREIVAERECLLGIRGCSRAARLPTGWVLLKWTILVMSL